jgi:hypothetical protein
MKTPLIESLYSFVRQRPGMEFGNYGNVAAYRSESRSITRDRDDALELLAFVSRSPSIGSDRIISGLSAYSGRLEWDGKSLSYCAGQYFPTEYRKAVCVCLASTLWAWFRDECECDTREAIVRAAKRNFSRRVVRRWFN